MLKKAYTPVTVSQGRSYGGMTPRMTPGATPGKRVQFVSTPSSQKTDRTVVLSKSK